MKMGQPDNLALVARCAPSVTIVGGKRTHQRLE
jgi:hypothetical protein